MLIWIYARPLYQIVGVMIAGVIIWTILAHLCGTRPAMWYLWKYVNFIFAMVAAVGIFYITIFRRDSGSAELSLIPFYSFYAAKAQPEIYRSMLMNVFLFVPFGLTMPYTIGSRNTLLKKMSSSAIRTTIIVTILAGCLFSCGIEVIQYLFCLGRAEIDDVLCNTLGTAIGSISWVLYTILQSD